MDSERLNGSADHDLGSVEPDALVTPTPIKRAPAGWRERFLDSLAHFANVTHAADVAGVSRLHAYRTARRDPAFKRKWKSALRAAADRLEKEAWKRATKGVKVEVYQGGRLAGYRIERSDQLLMFLLKGVKPEKFADRSKVEHSASAQPLVDAEAQRRLLADPRAVDLMAQLEALEAEHRALPAPD